MTDPADPGPTEGEAATLRAQDESRQGGESGAADPTHHASSPPARSTQQPSQPSAADAMHHAAQPAPAESTGWVPPAPVRPGGPTHWADQPTPGPPIGWTPHEPGASTPGPTGWTPSVDRPGSSGPTSWGARQTQPAPGPSAAQPPAG